MKGFLDLMVGMDKATRPPPEITKLKQAVGGGKNNSKTSHMGGI